MLLLPLKIFSWTKSRLQSILIYSLLALLTHAELEFRIVIESIMASAKLRTACSELGRILNVSWVTQLVLLNPSRSLSGSATISVHHPQSRAGWVTSTWLPPSLFTSRLKPLYATLSIIPSDHSGQSFHPGPSPQSFDFNPQCEGSKT